MGENTNNADKHRNIELKAKVNGEEDFEHRLAIAKKLTGGTGTLINQKDVFFNVSKGRLKLRYLTDKKSELISYDRPDVAGPKLSVFSIMNVDDPQLLEKMLAETVGVRGRVIKKRWLFLQDQTRIHLDIVESLGHFLEFEVMLRSDQSIEEGQEIVAQMKRTFEISEDDLIHGAYIDQLLK
ncbi:uncharacterized protein LOC128729058 [Anopheles nili]|uniref:uncharacterized protein LOC128729058 n=1 Tax=Anopheles nili TaxID=185578 RepID=UPI00237B7631|nr:uncharacterized protein LOC128729058 [Anopheles nili]